MKIAVCIKQVPDTTEVRLDPKTNTLIREGVPSIINPDDKAGLEAAFQLKEQLGATVTAVCMGPPQADVALREALAMGCDKAVLISGREFSGSDTYATAAIIAAALKKTGFDLIITGRQAIDGDTAQVGPEVAEHLGLPQVTYVTKIEVDSNTARVEREHEEGYEVIELKLPAVFTFVKSANEPRHPTIHGIMRANRAEIPVWSLADLGVDEAKLGLKGSPTLVRKIFTPKQRTQGILITKDTAREAVAELIDKLAEAKIV